MENKIDAIRARAEQCVKAFFSLDVDDARKLTKGNLEQTFARDGREVLKQVIWLFKNDPRSRLEAGEIVVQAMDALSEKMGL